jgi:predicted dehydrogenase
MKRTFKVVLVGCGYIARKVHLPLLTHFKDVKVSAVCDIDKVKASRMAEDFNVPRIYTDVETMLEEEEPDLVDICTPPATHGDILKRSLSLGYPCMVEKPLTTTTIEADEVIRISKDKGVGLYVLHTYSFLPCVRRARQFIANNSIGEVINVETHYFTSLQRERYKHSDHWVHKLPGGILNSEITPHLLMLLLEFLGDINDVKVFTYKLSDFPYIFADELRMVLRSTNSVGYLCLSFNSPILHHSLNIVGKKGYLSIDFFTNAVVYHKSMPLQTPSSFLRGMWALKDISQRITSLLLTTTNVMLGRQKLLMDGHRYLMRECFKSLRGESQYPVDLGKCREVVRLIEFISKNVQTT